MPDLLEGFRALPPHGLGAAVVLLLYAVQSEVRFGKRARSLATTRTDRGSSMALTLAALIPIFGFPLAMKAGTNPWIPDVLRPGSLPGMPGVAWAGVTLGAAGLALRLWAVLTLRERYTRMLLTHDQHAVERRGPYRWVRHPGYLGSLLCLNGIAMASGNLPVLLASLAATLAAYAYRIRVEDAMLLEAFGETYAAYRRDVGALIPFLR